MSEAACIPAWTLALMLACNAIVVVSAVVGLFGWWRALRGWRSALYHHQQLLDVLDHVDSRERTRRG